MAFFPSAQSCGQVMFGEMGDVSRKVLGTLRNAVTFL